MTLVDRDQELSALETWWNRVRTGRRSATVAVQGPAGIGKTALVQTWLKSKHDAGQFVLSSQADDYASSPFAPIRWALETTDNTVAAAERERCLTALRNPSGDAPPQAPISTLLAAYLRAASDGTAIVTIEDIHVADDDTLRLCTELGRLVDVPILLILTYRASQGRTSMGFESYLSRQIDVGLAHRITLRPLSATGARQLLAEKVTRELTAEQLRALAKIADGSPLFLGLAARLFEESADTDSPDRWPHSARDELLRRFVPIDSTEAILGAQLAEFGRFNWADLPRLASVTGVGEDDVRDALSVLLRNGVLRRTAAGLEFTHPLIREAFANLLDPERRLDFHLQLARILFDSGAAESLFEAATHLNAAGTTRGDDQLEALLSAAKSAMWVSPAPAAAWFQRIRTSPAASRALRAQATAGEMTALMYAGRTAAGLELCMAAMAALPPENRPAALIEGTASTAFPTRDLHLVVGLLDEDSPAASTTTLRSYVAIAQVMLGEVKVGHEHYRRALRELIDDPQGTPPMPFLLLFGLAAVFGEVDNVRLLRGLTVHKAAESTPVERELLLSCIDLQASHMPADLIQRESNTALSTNRVSTAGTQEVVTAFRYFQVGEWDNLLEYVPAQLELLRATGNILATTGLIGCAAAVLIERGQWSAAAAMAAQEDWPDDPIWGTFVQVCLARLEVSRGQSDTAIERLSAIEHTLRASGLIPMYSMVVDLLSQLLLNGGDHDAADRIVRGAREHVGGLDIPFQDAYTLLALARTTEDLPAAHAALAAAEKMPMPFLAARCEVQLARLGDSPSKRLRRAHQTFKDLGAVTERTHAEQVMRNLGVTTPRGRGDVDRLTAVESTIVRAVMQGHTNRRIASDLHYSPKTIEMHLSRIYSRTNRSGRVDLVKAVTEGDVALTDS